MTTGAVHPTVASYGVVDGVLTVGGIPIDRLAQRVGGTPFFAYDRAMITERVGRLRRRLRRSLAFGRQHGGNGQEGAQERGQDESRGMHIHRRSPAIVATGAIKEYFS